MAVFIDEADTRVVHNRRLTPRAAQRGQLRVRAVAHDIGHAQARTLLVNRRANGLRHQDALASLTRRAVEVRHLRRVNGREAFHHFLIVAEAASRQYRALGVDVEGLAVLFDRRADAVAVFVGQQCCCLRLHPVFHAQLLIFRIEQVGGLAVGGIVEAIHALNQVEAHRTAELEAVLLQPVNQARRLTHHEADAVFIHAAVFAEILVVVVFHPQIDVGFAGILDAVLLLLGGFRRRNAAARHRGRAADGCQLFNRNDLRAGFRSRHRRRSASRARADDQHIAGQVGIGFLLRRLDLRQVRVRQPQLRQCSRRGRFHRVGCHRRRRHAVHLDGVVCQHLLRQHLRRRSADGISLRCRVDFHVHQLVTVHAQRDRHVSAAKPFRRRTRCLALRQRRRAGHRQHHTQAEQ